MTTPQTAEAAEAVALLTKTAEAIRNVLNSCPLPPLDRTILAAHLEDIDNHLKKEKQ